MKGPNLMHRVAVAKPQYHSGSNSELKLRAAYRLSPKVRKTPKNDTYIQFSKQRKVNENNVNNTQM